MLRKIRIYKRLARPTLSYGNESWTTRRTDERGPDIKMLFMRMDAGYPLSDSKGTKNPIEFIEQSTKNTLKG
jgi:hypothetical protein